MALKRTGIVRRTPLPHAGIVPGRQKQLATKAKHGSKQLPKVSADVRAELYERQNEHCPVCGLWLPLYGAHVQHRLPVSRGGTNDPANLILLHPLCHVVGPKSVHQNPTLAMDMGWTLSEHQDPAEVPVQWAVAS